MLALLAACLFVCQDPQPPKPSGEPPPAQQGAGEKVQQGQEPDVPAAEAWDDRTAKDKVRAFDKLQKQAQKQKPSMAARKQALDELAGGGSNKNLIKPLQQVIEKDASVVIKKHAVALLAQQPRDEANAAIRKLLKNPTVTANAPVHAGLLRGLARTGYTDKSWAEIEDVFEADYDPERVAVHEAILDIVTENKEKRALPMLLRNLDEPIPGDVDVADNPPAEYWKARWTSWSSWRGKVKAALFAITGQNFSTRAEAKAWLEKNPIK